jgi:hypothetical protein
MDEITDAIIRAANQPIDETYNAKEVRENLEEEIIEIAKNIDATEINPRLKIKDKEDNFDGYEDPYPQRKHKSAEAEMQDRLLTIPLRPKHAPWGSLWIIHTGFIDQIALLNITKSEQRGLLRQWEDIQVLAEGDGNKDIVEAEQDKFAIKIVSYKSRSDNPEKGIRERTAHITNKTINDQTVTMPKQELTKSGFLNTILGRNK